MAFSQILFEVEAGVATITLNRPEHMNTWTSVMASELSDAMHRCNDDDEIRAVVLTGAGDRAFCAGADLGRGDKTFAGRENRDSHRRGERENSVRIRAARRVARARLTRNRCEGCRIVQRGGAAADR